jgi:hypothetical protein
MIDGTGVGVAIGSGSRSTDGGRKRSLEGLKWPL